MDISPVTSLIRPCTEDMNTLGPVSIFLKVLIVTKGLL